MKTLLVCSLLFLASSAVCQTDSCITPSQRAAIIAGDRFTSDTLWFGFDPLGTCGIDTGLCGEATDWPPPPPAGVFDARWGSLPGGCTVSPHFDYRGYVSSTAADTHFIHLQAGGDETPPPTLRWNKDSVAQMCDSALLIDVFGGFFVRKRMDRDSLAVINDLVINSLLLVRYGQRLTSMREAQQDLPKSAILYQNYPNPFNPSTRIRFFVPQSSTVKLAVYDLLGREIALVVDEPIPPGFHERAFNSMSLSSGLYLCRLAAGTVVQTTKMLILR